MKRAIFMAIIIIILITITFVCKFNTDVFCANYFCPNIDAIIYIDDHLIISDSIKNSVIPKKISINLRYGIHTIRLVSKTANIDISERFFLLPSQYIYIEFIGVDTLCNRSDLSQEFNTNNKSTFLIINRFGQYRLE